MRVLIVEDERKISAYVKRGLEEQGYAVDAAYTGKEALDFADAAPYDLILLDILLPEMDGLEVCRELQRKGNRTPVLMLTARDAIDDRVAGLDAGADDYLVKPFALKELLARLRALNRRGADVPKSSVLQLADLTLDTLTRRVKRGTKPLNSLPRNMLFWNVCCANLIVFLRELKLPSTFGIMMYSINPISWMCTSKIYAVK